MATPLETDDAIVLLLGAPGGTPRSRGRIEGITRLEKLLFLLEKETDAAEWLVEDADFRSDRFGPFSRKAYQEIETLVSAGLVVDSATPSSSSDDSWESVHVIGVQAADPFATRDLSLTDVGKRYYKALLKELPEDAEGAIGALKQRFASVPLRRLIRYVYERYPEFTDKSEIRSDILGE